MTYVCNVSVTPPASSPGNGGTCPLLPRALLPRALHLCAVFMCLGTPLDSALRSGEFLLHNSTEIPMSLTWRRFAPPTVHTGTVSSS